MGNLRLFLKENKKKMENKKYPATSSLCDENGEPLMWEIRPLTTKKNDELRDECTKDIPVPGKPGIYHSKFNATKYIARMIATCVVYPNLNDASLQDSYGVKTPEDLITEMIDNPAEYNSFAEFIQHESGIDTPLNEKVDTAKN